MTFIDLAPLLAALLNFPLALFVFSRDPNSRINQVFLLWGAALSIWNGGAFMMFHVDSADWALIWARILHFGVIFIPPTVLHLSLLISKIDVKRWILIPYVVALVLAGTNFSGLFVEGVRHSAYAWYGVPGPTYFVYSAIFPFHAIPALVVLFRRRRESQLRERRRLSTLITANAGLLVFGGHDLLPIFGQGYYPLTSIPVYPWGTLMAAFYGLLVGYSVLQDRLLDVRVTLGRSSATIVRLMFLVSFSFALLLVAAVFNREAFTPYSFISAIVVIVISAVMTGRFFPKLLGVGSEHLERRILGDQFEYQERLGDFIPRMPYYANAEELLAGLKEVLIESMEVKALHMIALDNRSQMMDLVLQFPEQSKPLIESVEAGSALFDFFRKSGESSLDLTVLRKLGPGGSRVLLGDTPFDVSNAEYCFPLLSNNEPFGLLLLGPKKSGLPFTAMDVDLLESLTANLSLVLDQLRLKSHVAMTERWDSIATMARGLAHDINNLLTPLSTFFGIINMSEVDESRRELAGVCVRNVTKIQDYVKEALFFSRTQQPRWENVIVAEVLNSVQENLQEQFGETGQKLKVAVGPGLVVRADRVMLVRILTNLVSNASDASPRETVIELDAALRMRPGTEEAHVRFWVRDRGAGISPENLRRVFAPYFSTKSYGDGKRGFGLGLSICQRLAFLHDGAISIESEMGVGTTVILDLPKDGPNLNSTAAQIPENTSR